jgi:hypothetical protein
MTDSVKQVWRDLGEQVSALGASIHDRFQSAATDDAEPGDRAADDDALRNAFDRLVEAGKELGDRLGDIAHDDEVRQRAKGASVSLDAALTATVDLVSGKVHDLVQHDRQGGSTDPAPPSA